MRYPADHKSETKDRILATAAKQFRAGGIADTGIAGIMSDAGLTNGAFYSHFRSKNDLVQQAISETLRSQREEMLAQTADHDLRALVAGYLSTAHRDQPEAGCPSAAMLPEIGRGNADLKNAYREALDPTLALILSLLPGDPGTARSRATAIFGLLIGSMQIARATADPATSDDVLQGAVDAAMTIANS